MAAIMIRLPFGGIMAYDPPPDVDPGTDLYLEDNEPTNTSDGEDQ